MKEMDDIYYYLERLKEAYCLDRLNSQERLAIDESLMKLEGAILNVEVLLRQLISQKEGHKQ
ncbi:MAG: hypothetical protein H6Q67_1648 [Firmicutes bacterium]|nr:hypothetical protein [Bacillota bacterium]